MKNFHHFPKNTPTGYPDLKKTGPLGGSEFFMVLIIQTANFLSGAYRGTAYKKPCVGCVEGRTFKG